MAIPSWLWLAVGVIVSVYSYLQFDKLMIFFYVGLVFVAVGIGKLIASYSGKKTAKPGNAASKLKRCIRCSEMLHHSANYCSKCGTRIHSRLL